MTKTTFKRSITLDMFCTMSCPAQRCCLEISLPDLIVISWEAQADICALSTGVVVVKKQTVSVYNLEVTGEEEALSSLIIHTDSSCTTCLI